MKPNETSPLLNSDIIKRPFIFQGTQEDSWGPVDVDLSKYVVEVLQNATHPAIAFDKNRIVSKLEGGTCSAMSLCFLKEYLQLRDRYLDNSDFKMKILQSLDEKKHHFAKSSLSYRVVQAALNTFRIKEVSSGEDLALAKVQAMLHYYQMIAHEGSEVVHFDAFSNDKYARVIKALPDGVFFLRFIKPANNDKLEEMGHSMVYIKEKGLRLFYDPNDGLKNQVDLLESSNHFIGYWASCQLRELRLYRVSLQLPRC